MRRPTRTERGVTAVVTALAAVSLFGFAALSVDVGNSWSHRRQVQNQADQAALAGGALLPRTAITEGAISLEVLKYLKSNAVQGQSDSALWTAAQLTDGAEANGEVIYEAGNDNRLEVRSPEATVTYGPARALGYENGLTSATATVEIQSPGSVTPFFLLSSSGCSFGPQVLKAGPTTGSAAPTAEPTPTWSPAGANTNNGLSITSVTPTQLRTDQSWEITVAGESNFIPTSIRTLFTRGTANEHIDAVVSSYTTTPGHGRSPPSYSWSVSVTAPNAVGTTDGVWWLRVERLTGGVPEGNPSGQNDAETLTVEAPADQPDHCGEKNLGDFGLMDSPRLGVGEMDAFALNADVGLDHPLVIYSGMLAPEECDGHTPQPGEVLDNADNLAAGISPNCLYIETGNKVSWVTRGLVGPEYTVDNKKYYGRLSKDSTDHCQARGAPKRMTAGDFQVNADTLECFIDSPGTVESVSGEAYAATAPLINGAIFSSPRFLWVPLLNGSANPGNGYYPIVGYRPVFLSEMIFSGGDNKIAEIRVIGLNAQAFPETASVDGEGIPYLGSGTKLVRLID